MTKSLRARPAWTSRSLKFSRIAFLFPGQGSQKAGMGRSLYDNSPAARMVWDEADSTLAAPVSSLAFEGPDDLLRQTRNAQTALFVSEVAAFRALQDRGVRPAYCAGHSIGEYAALVAAGALSLEQGLKLVQVRASAMERAAAERPGTMAAVIGLAAELLKSILEEASSAGAVHIANFNSPEQVVISGEAAAVELAGRLASEAGAKRVLPLAVSGGFHSPLMQAAAAELADVLAGAVISGPVVPVVLNVTADFARGAEDIRECLARQVVSQVRWHESIIRLVESGCDAAVEVGPGRVLTGLLKRMDGAPAASNVETADDLESAVCDLAG